MRRIGVAVVGSGGPPAGVPLGPAVATAGVAMREPTPLGPDADRSTAALGAAAALGDGLGAELGLVLGFAPAPVLGPSPWERPPLARSAGPTPSAPPTPSGCGRSATA